MATNIIGLIGYAQSGKDSFASFLLPFGWRRHALADALKKTAYVLNPIVENLDGSGVVRLAWLVDNVGWEQAKQSKDVRELLQRLGTEVGHNLLGENVWVNLLSKRIAESEDDLVVVTDVRFPNEAEWILDLGGSLIRITRPGVGPVNGHASESLLSGFDVAYEVENVGDLNDLADSARVVHNWITAGG
jgi:hypothetical protein